MKTGKINLFIVILILFMIGVSNSFGQLPPKYFWKPVQSPIISNLKDIYFRFIVGDNGIILYDTGYYNYMIIPDIPNYSFNGVCANNQTYVTVVGNNGIIYYSPGFPYTAWSLQPSGTTVNLNSVIFAVTRIPLLTRLVVGDGGTILKSTSDYPVSWSAWSPVMSNTTQNLNSIAFDTNSALIAGNNGVILRSTDKGNNWSLINSGYSNNLNFVYITPYYFQECWVTGDNGLILKSTNAGLNWIQVLSGTTANLKSFSPYFVCGTNGTTLRSLDSGLTWISTQTNTMVNLNASSGNSSYNCFIAGNNGTILKWDIDSSYIFRKLEENSISTFIMPYGIFNRNINVNNTAGFEWPKGSNKCAIYSSGLSMSATVQGQIRQAMASYKGEMIPGYCINGIPYTNDTFKVYSVKRSDNPNTNPDWAYWGLMVPYGAPFVDVNNNGNYEPMIDTPGVKNSAQTVFVCMTDGFASSHIVETEGFGGGTLPMNNEVHLTAWCYSQPLYTDMQFLKFEVINKGNAPWMRTYFTFYMDTDLGYAEDDFIGCDTVRKLGFCYNSDNNDLVYGANPPAVGCFLLKGAYRKYVNPAYLGMTAFTSNYLNEPLAICERAAYFPLGAYYYMMGYKIDSTCWLDPTQSPKKKTKFIYSGDPETNTGWTEYKGSVLNCGNDTLGNILQINPAGDRLFMLSSGSDDITVIPGDTQQIVMCQLIARGSSNLNSVTKLKFLSDIASSFYNNGGSPQYYTISGNVKYADNNQPVTSGYVKALKLHLNTLEFETVDSTGILPNGTYSLTNVRIDSVYIRPYPNSTPIVDFIPTFYPSSINWETATKLYVNSNLSNINVGVIRVNVTQSQGTISGTVSKPQKSGLNEALVYAKLNNIIKGFAISGNDGNYLINNIPAGTYNVIANRPGYYSDSTTVVATGGAMSNINFTLQPYYTSVKNISTEVPNKYQLYQNYPNPFNSMTKIKFDVPMDSRLRGNDNVLLKVYDLLGREVATLVNEKLQPGTYEFTFDGSRLASGMYFCRLSAENFSQTIRFVLVK